MKPFAPLNAWLDELPRTRFGRFGREVPAFRSAGVAGYYAALAATLAGGLLAGRSLAVLGLLAAVCAASFYAWAHVRRAITGREQLVLLEHVWIAQLASAGALLALGEPVIPYLDVIAVGLAIFLAFGRAGCLLVGCCHGKPASVGVAYGEEHARDGFPRHLVGVRLFPVPALESLGLLAIGVAGLAALRSSAPGGVLVWFLAAYAILRFGLEALRGDARPHALGLSVGRWMAVAELCAALFLGERRGGLRGAAAPMAAVAPLSAVAALLAVALLWRNLRAPARAILAERHVRAVRELLGAELDARPSTPSIRKSPLGIGIAVSAGPERGGAHVSVRLPEGMRDLPLLCALAARAFPELDPGSAQIIGRDVLLVHLPSLREAPAGAPSLDEVLYGRVVRQLQVRAELEEQRSAAASSAPTARREAEVAIVEDAFRAMPVAAPAAMPVAAPVAMPVAAPAAMPVAAPAAMPVASSSPATPAAVVEAAQEGAPLPVDRVSYFGLNRQR
ncbi:MAG TPA: prolipoprotein diacylglyceryl transferase family protein [Sorangium sp.]|nr:prolipoprotein diacylglyceryl transferase family protein [Sorangium sp.]